MTGNTERTHGETETKLYSPNAMRVSHALAEAGNYDPIAERFATAVGQAITRYDAGFIQQGPIGSFLFLVPSGVSMEHLLSTLAEEWLEGKTWDGSPSYFYVNCSALTGYDQRVLMPLIGGPLDGGRGTFMHSRLAQFTYPHFAIRANHFLRNIENWRSWLLDAKDYRADLKELRFQKRMDEFHTQLAVAIEEVQRQHYEDLEKESPFLSVVVFDGLSAASYFGLIDIIVNIVQMGTQVVWPNSILDFSHSLIIAIAYDDFEGESGKPLGFTHPVDRNGRWDAERYKGLHERGCRWLKGTPQLGGLVRVMGDNVFILRNKSYEEQEVHIRADLNNMKDRLMNVGIAVDWSECFIQELASDTKDETLRRYTDGRIRSVLDRYVFYPLAQQVLQGQLREGVTLYFNSVRTGVELCRGGEGKVLTSTDIRGVWGEREIGAKHFDPEILERSRAGVEGGDGLLARIHDEALKIMANLVANRSV